MKKLIISVLILFFLQNIAKDAKPTDSINKILSKAYSTKTFARGKLELQNTESKESVYIYYDGTCKQVNMEDGYYTIEIQNPDKLNILIAHPESISINAADNEKNKVLGMQITNEQFQFFTLKKEAKDNESKLLAEWKIKEAKLKKDQNGNYFVPANTLIIPIYNKKLNLCLENICWKRDYNSNCLPTIVINGEQEEVDAILRKACWLHMKISQLHSKQKSKTFKEDNREISFLN